MLYLSLVEHTRFYANSQNTVAQVNTFLLFIVTFYQIIKNSIQKTVVNSVKTQIHRLGREGQFKLEIIRNFVETTQKDLITIKIEMVIKKL